MPKGVYERTPANKPKPRAYPPEIVEAVRRMYLEQGMTVVEVQSALPRGYKAQTIIERHIPERRSTAKREQRGPRNSTWRGDAVSYQGVHVRLVAVNGRARDHRCVDCGDQASDWSYQGGCQKERTENGLRYSPNLASYAPRCRKCHRAHDKAMRESAAQGGDANVR